MLETKNPSKPEFLNDFSKKEVDIDSEESESEPPVIAKKAVKTAIVATVDIIDLEA